MVVGFQRWYLCISSFRLRVDNRRLVGNGYAIYRL